MNSLRPAIALASHSLRQCGIRRGAAFSAIERADVLPRSTNEASTSRSSSLNFIRATGASVPPQSQADALRKEIVRLANRIQIVENPELLAAEAGDRWLDRLSIMHGPQWELEEVLTASVNFCRDFAVQQLRSGKPEMAAAFAGFAAQFDYLRKEHFSATISPAGADQLGVAPPKLRGHQP